MKPIVSALIVLIVLVGMIPFLDAGTKIEWTTYLGVPLVILTGSAGVAFLTKRFEAIIGGLILGALWPVLYKALLTMLRSL